MILLIDNYDSFVYNLARYVKELGYSTLVVRNDKIDAAGVKALNPQALIFSPGPCAPAQAGICLDLVTQLSQQIPMLGVCLGHQVIAQAFGGKVGCAKQVMHGRFSLIRHNEKTIFKGLPNPLKVARYHSLIAYALTDTPLVETASSLEGEVMAFAHKKLPIFGVQFHPESVLTQEGHKLLRHFLCLTHLRGWTSQ